jgi:hypothetical protein
MKRATITIPDDLETELGSYMARQDAPPPLTSIVEAALRRFLEEKRLEAWQYQPPRRPALITPAPKGSGEEDIAREHDRHLADDE